MKASELIDALTEPINKHGDVEVVMTVDWTSSIEKATYHEEDKYIHAPYIELD